MQYCIVYCVVALVLFTLLRRTHDSLDDRRQQQLKNVCSRLRFLSEEQRMSWELIFVSDKLQYVFCCNPKVACTSWRLALVKLTGKYLSNRSPTVRVSDRFVRRGVHYRHDQRSSLLKKYYKFMIVREPLERLVSAYLDKCVHIPSYEWCVSAVRKRGRSSNGIYQGETAAKQCVDLVCCRSTTQWHG